MQNLRQTQTLKAASLHQPYAFLLATGEKLFETRSWRPKSLPESRLLWVHSSQAFPRENMALCETEPFAETLHRHGIKNLNELALGFILGRLTVGNVYTIVRPGDESTARGFMAPPAEPELSFGDYRLGLGRVAWRCHQPQLLATPIRARGKLGLWDYEVQPGDSLEFKTHLFKI